MKILLVAINAKYIHSNLAVYCLKSYTEHFCKNDKMNIEIAEYTINNEVDDIINNIYLEKPDVLAFSCYIWNIEYVSKVLTEIKKILPNVRIWLGGPEASYNGNELMEKHSEIDVIIKGEGEETFKELTELFEEAYGSNSGNINEDSESMAVDISEYIAADINMGLYNIKGIDYRTIGDGRLRSNAMRNPINMDDIPFPYKELSDFENRIIYYESSRGCPFSCSYCLSSIEKKLRFRSIELVKKELQFFLDNKVPQVKFVDRTFNCKKSHAMDIWQYILEHDNGITNFHFEIAADLIDEEELVLLQKMRPGLIQLEIGVQSVNEDTIEEIKRKMDIDKVKSVVDRINSFGNIHQHLDLIAGLPKENLNDFIHSFNTVYNFKPQELQLGFLKVLSGSYMHEQKENYGIAYREFPPYEVLYTNWMSYEDILLLKSVEEMVECYFNSAQFTLSLAELQNYYEEPFKMFEELGNYYKEHFNSEIKHSRIARYNILLDFYKERIIEGDIASFIHCLTFDVYLRENAKKRPDYAMDMGIYKDLIKTYAKQENLMRSEHIEVIDTGVYDKIQWQLISDVEFLSECKLIEPIAIEGTVDNEERYKYLVIFDYSYKNPLTHQCKVKVVKVNYDKKEC